MVAITPGVPWTSEDTDDNTTELAARNEAAEDAIGGLTGEELAALASDAELAAAIAGIDLSGYVAKTGAETIAGVKTFSSDPLIPDEAYDATAWNGVLEPPTKNAVRDKLEAMLATADVFQMFAPTTVNAADDEFDDGSIAGAWTQLNVTGTITWAEAKHALCGRVTSDIAVSDLNAILKACTIAVGEYVEIMVRVLGMKSTSTGVLLCLTDGVLSTSVPLCGGLYMAGSDVATTWSINGGTMDGYSNSVNGSNTNIHSASTKIRIRRSASTTYVIEYSIDGAVWTDLGVAALTSSTTFTHAGIAMTNVNGVNTGVVRIEYFRKGTA